MSDQYATIRARMSAAVLRNNAPVAFTIPGATLAYDATSGLWSGTEVPRIFAGFGAKIRGNPQQLAANNLVLVNPITLVIDALTLRSISTSDDDPVVLGVPVAGMAMAWNSLMYTVRLVLDTGPNGRPIYFTVWATV